MRLRPCARFAIRCFLIQMGAGRVTELIAKSPAEGELPLTLGGLSVVEIWPLQLTSVAPLAGADLGTALGKIGLTLPPTGKASETNGTAILWTGFDQYMLIGTPPMLPAAMTDQSDGWSVVDISGPDRLAVLARLCPLDLEQMPDGAVGRSHVGHLNAVIWRRRAAFRIMVYRAFARTLIRELREVAELVDARHRL